MFGKTKSSTPEPLSLDPQPTMRRLAAQQSEAAARGERVVNQLPASVRQGYLIIDVVERLRQLNQEEDGISASVAAKLEEIDVQGTMAAIRSGFEAVRPDLPVPLLQEVEAKSRADDAASSRPKYDDIEPLVPTA